MMPSIQRIIFFVNLALITLGAYFGVSLFYQVMAHQFRPSVDAQIVASQPTNQKRARKFSLTHYRPIMKRNLFQTQKGSVAPPPKANIDLENMAETKLNLKLWGTVTTDPEKAYAVIEDTKKREQNLYRIGDSIQNATLKLIQRTKVVLSLNGKDEVLTMEEIKQAGGSKRGFGKRSSRSSSSRRGPTRTQRVSLKRSMIDNAINDVSSLMTQIKIQPHENGLSLSNIKANSIFRRMGLRNGDVLKSVDGQDIRSVDDALRLYESLKSTDAVSVQLERRGSDRTINYNIR